MTFADHQFCPSKSNIQIGGKEEVHGAPSQYSLLQRYLIQQIQVNPWLHQVFA